MIVALTPRRFLVMRREEVAAAALMNVDACRYVEQKLYHCWVLVHDRHVQYILTCQSRTRQLIAALYLSLLYVLGHFGIYTIYTIFIRPHRSNS